jgi:hypothetical protein
MCVLAASIRAGNIERSDRTMQCDVMTGFAA